MAMNNDVAVKTSPIMENVLKQVYLEAGHAA